jgi:hypothetical protein
MGDDVHPLGRVLLGAVLAAGVLLSGCEEPVQSLEPVTGNMAVYRDRLERRLLTRHRADPRYGGKVARVELELMRPVEHDLTGKFRRVQWAQLVYNRWGERIPALEEEFFIVEFGPPAAAAAARHRVKPAMHVPSHHGGYSEFLALDPEAGHRAPDAPPAPRPFCPGCGAPGDAPGLCTECVPAHPQSTTPQPGPDDDPVNEPEPDPAPTGPSTRAPLHRNTVEEIEPVQGEPQGGGTRHADAHASATAGGRAHPAASERLDPERDAQPANDGMRSNGSTTVRQGEGSETTQPRRQTTRDSRGNTEPTPEKKRRSIADAIEAIASEGSDAGEEEGACPVCGLTHDGTGICGSCLTALRGAQSGEPAAASKSGRDEAGLPVFQMGEAGPGSTRSQTDASGQPERRPERPEPSRDLDEGASPSGPAAPASRRTAAEEVHPDDARRGAVMRQARRKTEAAAASATSPAETPAGPARRGGGPGGRRPEPNRAAMPDAMGVGDLGDNTPPAIDASNPSEAIQPRWRRRAPAGREVELEPKTPPARILEARPADQHVPATGVRSGTWGGKRLEIRRIIAVPKE